MARSYGFAPGGTSFDVAAAQYVSLRPDTTRLTQSSDTPPKPLDNLKQFVAELSGAQVERPVKDLMLASHGTSLGAMSMPFDETLRGQSYENVDAIANAGTVAIPSTVLEPRPLVHELPFPCKVRVVGCWIGIFPPYLQRLKDALGGKVEVVAPRHEDAFYAREKDGSAILKGSLRFLFYSFFMYALTPFKTRDDLIAVLKAKYKFFDGSEIPIPVWKQAIPKDFNSIGAPSVTWEVKLRPAAGGRKSIPVVGRYDRDTESTGLFPFSGGPAASASEADRRAFMQSKLAALDQYKPTHPLPMYVRAGYSSLAEFAQGYQWVPDAALPDQWYGFRERYLCTIPIWDPTNGRRELIHDYLSLDGTVKRIALEDQLTQFFTSV